MTSPTGATTPNELEAQLQQAQAERDDAVRRLDAAGRRTRRRARTRRVTVGVLVVLFAIMLPLTVTATWAHRTVLDTSSFVDTVGPIATDPAVTAAISRGITDQLYATLDPQQTVTAALPPKAKFLAGPITNGSKPYVQQAVDRVLSGPRFQQLWLNATRFSHTQLVAVLRGDNGLLLSTNGLVTLNLVPLLNAALQQVQGFASNVVGHPVTIPNVGAATVPSAACAQISAALSRPVPPTCGQVVLFRTATLAQARRGVRAFDRGVLALLIVTPLLLIGALWLSRSRRRTLLQLCFGAALGLVLFRRSLFWLQHSLTVTGRPENKDARAAIAHGLLGGYFTLTAWFLAGAALIVVVALVSGPYAWAMTSRQWVRTTGSSLAAATRGEASASATGGAVMFVRGHLDLFRYGGVAAALLLFLATDLGLAAVLVVVILLAAYELWLYRLRPPATITLPDGAAPSAQATETERTPVGGRPPVQ